jgi:hypothetical protein
LELTVGFELPQNNARIEFEGPYAGAEVVMSLDLSIDDALELEKLQANRDTSALFDAMSDLLISWNLERAGTAVPATREAFRAMPTSFLGALFTGYARAMTELVSVPAPSEGRSNGGDTSASPN